MGQLMQSVKRQNGLLRRFAEEEDAVGVVEIILILVEKPNAKHRYVLCGK